MTVTGFTFVGAPPQLSVRVGSETPENSPKPCWATPPIFVKSPPASTVPLAAAIAKTPRTPFALGCHGRMFPVSSSSDIRWSRTVGVQHTFMPPVWPQ